MMKKILSGIIICFFGEISAQLVTSNVKLWEKTPVALVQDSTKCPNEQLLNFNCKITGKDQEELIKYHKSKGHTLIAVQAFKRTDQVWKNNENKVNLSNDNFQKANSKESLNLKIRPSIFSYISPAVVYTDQKIDSVNINFSKKNIYELIFTDQRIVPSKQKSINSYLAIKYGISLEKGNYYNSKFDVIWDSDKQKEYKYRTTGIGRDDANELYQKQSTNQEDLFLTISRSNISRTNAENIENIKDNTFALWADDNNEMTFENDGSYNVLKRKWEINFINDFPKDGFSVRINKTKLNPLKTRTNYWMFIKKEDGSEEKIQGVEDDKFITFSKVAFNKENPKSSVFTFAMGNSGVKEKSESIKNINSAIENNDLNSLSEDIILYPNPVKQNGIFTVAFSAMKDLEISIYDSGGRMISSQKIESNAVKYYKQMNVQGLYIIRLTKSGLHLKTFKLIVN